MILKKLRWKNFLSYGKTFTEIDLDRNEIVNIVGTNGKGKSVFLDALHYALTNKPFRAVKMSEIPNSINKKNCLVELEAARGDNEILVRRGINPKVFEVHLNGRRLDEDSKAADQQKVLEQLLGFNSKTLRHTIIMSSMNYSPFLKMTAAEKRLFIDDMLNVSIFTELGVFVKQKFGLLKTRITDIEYSIKSLESNLGLIREMNSKVVQNSDEQIAMIEEKLASLRASIDETRREEEAAVGLLRETRAKLRDLESSLTEEVSRVQTARDERVDRIKTELREEKASIDRDKTETIAHLVAAHGKKLAELDKRASSISTKLADMRDVLSSKEESYNRDSSAIKADSRIVDKDKADVDRKREFLDSHSQCPTCERDIDDEFKGGATAELDAADRDIKNRRSEIEGRKAILQSTWDKIKSFREKVAEYERRGLEFERKVSDFKLKHGKEVSGIEREAADRASKAHERRNADIMEINKKAADKASEIKDKYNDEMTSLRERESASVSASKHRTVSIRDKEATVSDYEAQIDRLRNPEVAEVKDETSVLGELNEARKDLEALGERRRIFEAAIKLLSDKGFKTFVVNKYIPVLNRYVNEYLDLLEAHYRLKFDAELNEKIVARGYERLSYDSFSSGEKARCDLALLFAFLELSKRKNSVDSNLLVLDEVADNSLDRNGVYGVLNIINRLKAKGYTVYVISHRDEIKDEFDVTLEATKDTFSRLKEV